MYTMRCGRLRPAPRAARRCAVRASSAPSRGGGAQCRTASARPATRARLARSSRSPASGIAPSARRRANASLLRASANTSKHFASHGIARPATSPAPTIRIRFIAGLSHVMSFRITLQPGGQHFDARADQTVLEAALAAGFIVPYGCRDGACGACKAHIERGTIDQGTISEGALTPAEIASGQALLCQARACSDLEVTVRSITRAGAIAVKKLPCRVQSIERAASDVIVMHLKLPASDKFAFRAGQYIDFVLDEGRRRSFSIANAPAVSEHIE